MLTYQSGEIQPTRPIQHVDHCFFTEYGCSHHQHDEPEKLLRVCLPRTPPSKHHPIPNTNLQQRYMQFHPLAYMVKLNIESKHPHLYLFLSTNIPNSGLTNNSQCQWPTSSQKSPEWTTTPTQATPHNCALKTRTKYPATITTSITKS